jgi:hypothetical protein
MIKNLSDRISLLEKPNATSIAIIARKEDKSQTLLFTWMIFWTIAGIVVFTQLFGDYNSEQKMFMYVWMAFWLYFEYTVVIAFFWRKYGIEKILIQDNILSYKKDIKGKGKTIKIDLREISQVKTIEYENTSIIYNIKKSYWNLGYEKIEITHGNNLKFQFGLELYNAEALKIINIIDKKIKLAV